MAVQVTVPRLGWSMDEGTLVEWFKREGELVRKGDMLFSLEGDKATQEIESFDEGLLRFLPETPQPGDSVKVGQVLAMLVAEGESLSEEDVSVADEIISETSAAPVEVDAGHAVRPATRVASSSVKASPRARRAAAKLDVDWRNIEGTGKTGRVRERDVVAAAADPSSRAKADVGTAETVRGRLEPISPLRRMIATRMMEAVRQAAPVTLTTQADATALVELRDRLRASMGDGDAILPSYTDMVIKVVASELEKNPAMQAQWREEGLFVPSEVNICVAVDTESGLTVPVLRNVPAMTLSEIARETRRLAESARGRRLASRELQGGTFTITNLGSFGIDAFTPILPLPQSMILGIGRIALGPAVIDGQISPRHQVWLSLTFDHRIHDGAPAARFLSSIRTSLEKL